MAPVIRFMSEWQCWPTWDHAEGVPIDPKELDLPADLVARILVWDDAFQATLNWDDPPASAFPSSEAEAAWIREGDILLAELRAAGLEVVDRRDWVPE